MTSMAMNPWSHYPSKSILETVLGKDEKDSSGSAEGPRFSFISRHNPLRHPFGTAWNRSKMGIQTFTSQDDLQDCFTVTSASTEIPRRNLADAFELQADHDVDSPEISTTFTPATKQPLLEDSPVGVADLHVSMSGAERLEQIHDDQLTLPHFYLNADLKRDLSQALLDRVSFYGVIHDINKEATAMVANDFLAYSRVKSMDEEDEVFSPLVIAVNGKPAKSRQALSMAETALIDEEQWILSIIETCDERVVADCPPTFPQAMGEREYDRLESTRTQLWKPARSWWEAKSGKNPWIEPQSHNKRWR